MSTFSILVNGKPFGRWQTANVSRSIDSNTGTFSFDNSSLLPSQLPVRAGDPVQIAVNGSPLITGYVDEVAASGSFETHSINVSGRDTTCDLIDSSVPDAVKTVDGGISLVSLTKSVIRSLGANIEVVNSSGVDLTLTDEQLNASDGDTCIDFLMDYARKLQVYLIADGQGRLEIFRPGGSVAASPLLHLKGNGQNNVKSWDIKYSYTTRYNKYACNSQDSFGQDPLADSSGDGTSRAAYVTDSTIRAGRFLEIKAEESMTDAQCSKRANEEANLRRARSTVYTAIVAGTQQADGSNWNLGDLVTVQDDFAGLKGEYLIRALEYSISVSGGSNTRITIAPVDAYTVVGTKTTGSKRKSADGEEMVNPVAKLVSKYTRVVQKEVSIEDREILRRKKILGIK